MNKSPKLTRKQERFVHEYVVDLNAARAAEAAGFSPKTARTQASKLLTKHNIREAVDRLVQARLQKLDISAERVLNELARIAFLDARKFYREDGTLKNITELDDDTAAGLAGMEIEEAYEHFGKGQAKPAGVLKKIKFADKLRALELLGKHLKLFTEKIELSGSISIADRIAKGRQRVLERGAAGV